MANLGHPDADSLRLELQEAIITFRHQTLLLLQVAGFIVTADSLLLAYGFAQRESGILLIASAMPIIMLASFVEILNSSLPIAYVAMALEQKLHLRDAPLAAIFARRMRHISAIIGEDTDLMNQSVREAILRVSRRSWLNNRVAYILYAIFIAQIGLFLIATLTYDYRFM
jgi:hypothetical protein